MTNCDCKDSDAWRCCFKQTNQLQYTPCYCDCHWRYDEQRLPGGKWHDDNPAGSFKDDDK